MGVLSGLKEQDICALLQKQNINNNDSFVVARRHNSFLKGLLKLLASNLYYAMDATVLRVLLATEDEFIVINPNWTLKGDYKNLDPKHTQRIPWAQLENFNIEQNSRVAKISWTVNGKHESWVVDTYDPGVWHFNPQHLKNLAEITSQKISSHKTF